MNDWGGTECADYYRLAINFNPLQISGQTLFFALKTRILCYKRHLETFRHKPEFAFAKKGLHFGLYVFKLLYFKNGISPP